MTTLDKENSRIVEKLSYIQKSLKAPKGQFNHFGKYKYRSCEDILEAVKPLLKDSILIITDEVVQIGERYYIKAIATLKDNKEEISVSAYAREALTKKGMDDSQITGTASSYARKYALNGLLLIDDTKDADNPVNNDRNAKNQPPRNQPQKNSLPLLDRQIIDAISKNTDNFKNKDRLNKILRGMGVSESKEIFKKDENDKKQILTWLENLKEVIE